MEEGIKYPRRPAAAGFGESSIRRRRRGLQRLYSDQGSERRTALLSQPVADDGRAPVP